MRTKEVVVGNPECNVVVSTIDVIISAFDSIRGFEGTIKAFYHLLKGTELFGYLIIICRSNDLCDVKFKGFTKLPEELLGGKGIDTVAISNETEAFWKFFKMSKGHTHSHDTGTYTTVI